MTKWTITLHAASMEEYTKVVKVLIAAAKLGFKYSVTNKEIPVESTIYRTDEHPSVKEPFSCKDCNFKTYNKGVMKDHRVQEHGDQHYSV